MMQLHHDQRNDMLAILLDGKDWVHIGCSDELNLDGCTIVIDRDTKGRVRALEIINQREKA